MLDFRSLHLGSPPPDDPDVRILKVGLCIILGLGILSSVLFVALRVTGHL